MNTINTDILICGAGAAGLTLAIDFRGESMKMRAMVADLSLTGLGRDAWHRWGEGAGQLSLCPR